MSTASDVNEHEATAAPATCTFPVAAVVNMQSETAAPKIRDPITTPESNAAESVPAADARADISAEWFANR